MRSDKAVSSWVGWFHAADGAPTFIQIEPGGGDSALVNIPAHGWFRVSAATAGLDGASLRLSFAIEGVHVRLDGGFAADKMSGTTASGDHAGKFELWPAKPLDESSYRRFVSRFEGSGRAISLHIQSDTFFGEKMVLYLEGDQIVRLYPISGQRLVSEGAELLELRDDPPGTTATIVISRPGKPDPPTWLRKALLWDEEDVGFPGPAGRIAGTVMTPRANGLGAAVVLVHGSADGRRDFYRIFGEQFVHAGLTALIYDKRGHGQSDGTTESTILGRSHDAEAAVDFLRARPGMTAGTVGLYGFSNGAWSVPMVSGRRDDIRFVVVMGAPGVTPARSEVHRKVFELREQGIPDAECNLVATMWSLIYRYLASGSLARSDRELYDDSAQQLFSSSSLANVRLQQYAIEDRFLSPIPPYRTHSEVTANLTAGGDNDWSYDPLPDYRRTRCPVLFLTGELDQNLPAAESAERVSRVLSGSAHTGSVVRVFPRTGHMMNLVDATGLHGITTEEASYRFHRFQFAPGFLGLLREWSRAEAQHAMTDRRISSRRPR